MTTIYAARKPNMESMGKIAYEAYCENTGWKSLVSGSQLSGSQLPPWCDLSLAIQSAWEAAANAVQRRCCE